MSAIRTYTPEGQPTWTRVDDGSSPHRSSRGIRGAAFDNPVIGSMAVGESRYAGNRKPRPGKHAATLRP